MVRRVSRSSKRRVSRRSKRRVSRRSKRRVSRRSKRRRKGGAKIPSAVSGKVTSPAPNSDGPVVVKEGQLWILSDWVEELKKRNEIFETSRVLQDSDTIKIGMPKQTQKSKSKSKAKPKPKPKSKGKKGPSPAKDDKAHRQWIASSSAKSLGTMPGPLDL